MKKQLSWHWFAQLCVILIGAYGLKFYYSTASANQLRWILAPTTAIVELICATRFNFESHAGYLSADASFLIAPACAGVNFLLTAFLMLTLRRLVCARGKKIGWDFIPSAALIAYLVTVIANAVRIAIAFQLHHTTTQFSALNPAQIHRLEGILVYFGFLFLLFIINEKFVSEKSPQLLPRALFPLLIYYAITLAAPLANGAYQRDSDFWQHSIYVLIIPLILLLPFTAYYFAKKIFPTDAS